jgi:hypothetical protein
MCLHSVYFVLLYLILYLYNLCINVYVLFIVYVTLPPGISPIAVGIINNNNNNNNMPEVRRSD